MFALRLPESRAARAWPGPPARAVRAWLPSDAPGTWILLRTAFSFAASLLYWLEGGGRKRGAAGCAASRRRFSRKAVRAAQRRTLSSGSDDGGAAVRGPVANEGPAARCRERAPCRGSDRTSCAVWHRLRRRGGKARHDGGARSRCAATRHPELGPVAASRAVRPAGGNGVSAKAGSGPGDVPAKSSRRALRPAARRDRAGSEKARGNNDLPPDSGGAGRVFRVPIDSR